MFYLLMTLRVILGFFPCHKYEVFKHFSNFLSYVQTQFSMTIKQFQSDGGREFNNSSFKQLCVQKGIHHWFSCPHTSQQNTIAERKHRHITEMGRTLLLAAKLWYNLGAEALTTAVYLINHLPTHVLKWASPYNTLFGRDPDYLALCILGCACFPFKVITPLISYNLDLWLVFFLDTVSNTRDIAVYILLMGEFIYLALLFLLRKYFPMILLLSLSV